MAEALGVAASVSGLVSLGLQVAGGITSYIDAIKARKEELAAVSASVLHMQNSIDVLRDKIPGLSNEHQAASSAAISAMKRCVEELRGLGGLLRELSDYPSQNQSLQSTIRQQKKKLTYPFHRLSLDRLQQRLNSANDVLLLANQTLEL